MRTQPMIRHTSDLLSQLSPEQLYGIKFELAKVLVFGAWEQSEPMSVNGVIATEHWHRPEPRVRSGRSCRTQAYYDQSAGGWRWLVHQVGNRRTAVCPLLTEAQHAADSVLRAAGAILCEGEIASKP